MSVANAPGERILPRQLGKALEIIAAGGDVNYEGASLVELDDAGDPEPVNDFETPTVSIY